MSRARHKFPVLIISAAAALCACDRQPSVPPPPETRAERLAVVERIAAECQVPPATLELVGEDQLRLNPAPDLAYEKMECVLRRLDGLNLPPGNVGFVGNASAPVDTNNAAPTNEASNAQAD